MVTVHLSDAEFRIMLLLWEEPQSMPQILAKIGEETGWTKHAILTFLSRMIKKGAIEPIEAKPARKYRPLVSRDEIVQEETRNFIDRVYQGKAGLLIASLVQEESLSREEVEELAAMLERMREDEA